MTRLRRYHSATERETAYGVVGEKGGVHVWWSPVPSVVRGIDGRECYGGVEYHWAAPPDYRKGSDADNMQCFLLEAPCWHDGSSLQFGERYAHLVGDEEAIYARLESDYRYMCEVQP